MYSRGKANVGVKIEDASSSIKPSITEEPFEQKEKKAKKKPIEHITKVFSSRDECNK
jgi:hypothetical protein